MDSDTDSSDGSFDAPRGRGRGRGARGRGAGRGRGRGVGVPRAPAPTLQVVYLPNGTSKPTFDILAKHYDERFNLQIAKDMVNPHADAAAVRNCGEALCLSPAIARARLSVKGVIITVAPSEKQFENLGYGHYICYGAFGGGMAEDYKPAAKVAAAVAAGRMIPIHNWKPADGQGVTTVCGHRFEECNCHEVRGLDSFSYVGVDVFCHIKPYDLFNAAHRTGCQHIVAIQRLYSASHKDLEYSVDEDGMTRIATTYRGTGTYLSHDYTNLHDGGLFKVKDKMVVVSSHDIVESLSYGVIKIRATTASLGRTIGKLGRGVSEVESFGTDSSKVSLAQVGSAYEIVITNAGVTRRYVTSKAALHIACQMGVPTTDTVVGTNYVPHLRQKLVAAGLLLEAEEITALMIYAVCKASRGAITAGAVLAGLTGIRAVPKTLEDNLKNKLEDSEYSSAWDRLSRVDAIAKDGLTGQRPTGFAALCLGAGVLVLGACIVKGWKTATAVVAAGGVAAASSNAELINDLWTDVKVVASRYKWHALAVAGAIVSAGMIYWDLKSAGATASFTASAVQATKGWLENWWSGTISQTNVFDIPKLADTVNSTLQPESRLIFWGQVAFDSLIWAPLVEEATKYGFAKLFNRWIGVPLGTGAVASGALFGYLEACSPGKVSMVEHRMLLHGTMAWICATQGYWYAVAWHFALNLGYNTLMYRGEMTLGPNAFTKVLARVSPAAVCGADQCAAPTASVGIIVGIIVGAAVVCGWAVWLLSGDGTYELEEAVDLATYTDGRFIWRERDITAGQLPVALAAVCPLRDQDWRVGAAEVAAAKQVEQVKIELPDAKDCPLRLGSTLYFGVATVQSARPAMCPHSAAVALVHRHLKKPKFVAKNDAVHKVLKSPWGRRFARVVGEVGLSMYILSGEEYAKRLPTTAARVEFEQCNQQVDGIVRAGGFNVFPKDELHTYVKEALYVVNDKTKEARARFICSPEGIGKAAIGPMMYSFEKACVAAMRAGEDNMHRGMFAEKFSGDGNARSEMVQEAIHLAIAGFGASQPMEAERWQSIDFMRNIRRVATPQQFACLSGEPCGAYCFYCQLYDRERESYSTSEHEFEVLPVRGPGGEGAIQLQLNMIVPVVCGDDNFVVFMFRGILYAVRSDISGCDASTQRAWAMFRAAVWYGAGVIDKFDFTVMEGDVPTIVHNPFLQYFKPARRADITPHERKVRTIVFRAMIDAELTYKKSGAVVSAKGVVDSMQSGCADTSFMTTMMVAGLSVQAVSELLHDNSDDAPEAVIEECFRGTFAEAGFDIDVSIDRLNPQFNYAPLLPICSLLAIPLRNRFWLSNRPGRWIARQGNVSHTISKRYHAGHMVQMMRDALFNNYHNCIIRWLAQSILLQLGGVKPQKRWDRDEEYRLIYTTSMEEVFADITEEEDMRVLMFMDAYYSQRGAPPGFLVGQAKSIKEYIFGWRFGEWLTHAALVTMAEVDA